MTREQMQVVRLLEETGGNIAEAARRTGTVRQVMQRRLRKLGLENEPARVRQRVRTRFRLVD
jgi:transcriptional regulator with GAF, ATPase, and Fis domain